MTKAQEKAVDREVRRILLNRIRHICSMNNLDYASLDFKGLSNKEIYGKQLEIEQALESK